MADARPAGIIYPPPEIKAIIDKTSDFVARHGREFEGRIQQHEQDNPKFKFLDRANPYNAYYEMKIAEFLKKQEDEAAAAATAAAAPPAPAAPAAEAEAEAGRPMEEDEPAAAEGPEPGGAPAPPPATLPAGPLEVTYRKSKVLPKADPCPVLYTVAIPSDITPIDLDVIKLTAQYVARHGTSFLSNITGRENRNVQFDFLKGTHRWFQFFHSLVDAYAKILFPTPETVHELQNDVQDKLHIMDKCMGSHEFRKREEAKRLALEESEEKERVAFQLIDWHDFVVVETIDFNVEDEDELVPHGPFKAQQETPTPKAAPEPTPTPKAPDTSAATTTTTTTAAAVTTADDDDGLGDLDVDITAEVGRGPEEDEDDEDEEEAAPAPAPPPMPALGGMVAVVDGGDEEAPVVAEYRRADHRKGAGPVKVLDPHSGQLVDADMISEHMRIKTLDPKWKEQQEREKEKLSTTNLAPDVDMSRVLSKFAARRSDIFGDVEGRLGQNIAELSKPKENPLAAARAAAAAISAAMPASAPEPSKPHPPPPPMAPPGAVHIGVPPPGFHPQARMFGAPPGPLPGLPPMPPMPPGMPVPMMGGLGAPLGPPHPPPHALPHLPPPPPLGHPLPPGLGLPPHLPPPPPHLAMPPPAAAPPPLPDQPPPKRPRVDAQPPAPPPPPAQGPMTFTILLPVVEGSEYDLRGQSVNVTVSAPATIKEVKEAIQEVAGIPPGKCQLKDVATGAFLKDTQAPIPAQRFELAMRERGGKKKA